MELSNTFVAAGLPAPESGTAGESESEPAGEEPPAAGDEPPEREPQRQEPEPEPSDGGGCSIGSPGSTDLSAVMFGSAMLAGLGLMLVRQRKNRI